MTVAKYLFGALYAIALFSFFANGINCYFLMLYYRLKCSSALRRREELRREFYETLPCIGWPRVTIQLPIYNERYVVERLVKSACQIEYPKELSEIQVLDDPTDDCVIMAGSVVAEMHAQGFDIAHITRKERTGYKAGALREGLESAKGELVKSGFVRTPKYRIEKKDLSRDKLYRLPFNPLAIVELFFGLYSLTGLILFLFFSKNLISPFLFIYTVGFFYVFALSLGHAYGYAKEH
jgi:Glycosyl transferase family 2